MRFGVRIGLGRLASPNESNKTRVSTIVEYDNAHSRFTSRSSASLPSPLWRCMMPNSSWQIRRKDISDHHHRVVVLRGVLCFCWRNIFCFFQFTPAALDNNSYMDLPCRPLYFAPRISAASRTEPRVTSAPPNIPPLSASINVSASKYIYLAAVAICFQQALGRLGDPNDGGSPGKCTISSPNISITKHVIRDQKKRIGE